MKTKQIQVNQFDPFLGEEEMASVISTIQENWITEGKKTEEFQNQLKGFCNVKHAILLPNGTLALFVGLMIAGIKAGDEVIVPDFTFVGSATAIALTGAKPVFVDVNKDDFNIDVEEIKKAITKRTRAIMPVHIYGQTADMDGVLEVAREHGLKVIEDAAQGLGVTFGTQHVGTMGDVGCMSFYADKTITMGEGGAILTQSDEMAERCRYFKNQGRLERGSFVHPTLGYNFRITDLQAAIGVAQMKKVEFIMSRKASIEAMYKDKLSDVPEVCFSSASKAGARVPFRTNILVDDPEALMSYLTKQDIGMRRFFYPLHKQPCFTKENSRARGHYPVTQEIFEKGLSLPSGVGLLEEQIDHVCSAIKEFYTLYG